MKNFFNAHGEYVIPSEKCEGCDGTGEVHSHNPKCWDCNGLGYLTVRKHDPRHPGYQELLLQRFDPSI